MFPKLALAVFCIFCLVAINQAAPSDEPPSGGPKPTPPTGPADQMPKPGEPMDEDEDSEELVGFEDDEYDEEDDEEEFEDEEESPEGRLSELAEEHFAVKNDCTDMKTAIDESREASEQVDSELLKSYDECKQYLHEIERAIIELSGKLA